MGNHICCAEELVGCGALSERRDAHGQPVLQKAAERCGERMVEILVANGADLSACDEQYKTTPLMWAQVSIEVSNNPKCAEIAAYLESKAATPPG